MVSQHIQRLFEFSRPDPLLKSPVAGLEGRITIRQFTPLRAGSQHPQNSIQYRSRVMPRTPAIVRPTLRSQDRLQEFPLFFA
jgi:hypothetical protein